MWLSCDTTRYWNNGSRPNEPKFRRDWKLSVHCRKIVGWWWEIKLVKSLSPFSWRLRRSLVGSVSKTLISRVFTIPPATQAIGEHEKCGKFETVLVSSSQWTSGKNHSKSKKIYQDPKLDREWLIKMMRIALHPRSIRAFVQNTLAKRASKKILWYRRFLSFPWQVASRHLDQKQRKTSE